MSPAETIIAIEIEDAEEESDLAPTVDPVSDAVPATARRIAHEAHLSDLSDRLTLERIHEVNEWRTAKRAGHLSGDMADHLISGVDLIAKRRDQAIFSVAVTKLLLEEARRDLAYRASQMESHLAQIVELTAQLKAVGVVAKKKRFVPAHGLNSPGKRHRIKGPTAKTQ